MISQMGGTQRRDALQLKRSVDMVIGGRFKRERSPLYTRKTASWGVVRKPNTVVAAQLPGRLRTFLRKKGSRCDRGGGGGGRGVVKRGLGACKRARKLDFEGFRMGKPEGGSWKRSRAGKWTSLKSKKNDILE